MKLFICWTARAYQLESSTFVMQCSCGGFIVKQKPERHYGYDGKLWAKTDFFLISLTRHWFRYVCVPVFIFFSLLDDTFWRKWGRISATCSWSVYLNTVYQFLLAWSVFGCMWPWVCPVAVSYSSGGTSGPSARLSTVPIGPAGTTPNSGMGLGPSTAFASGEMILDYRKHAWTSPSFLVDHFLCLKILQSEVALNLFVLFWPCLISQSESCFV